MIIIALLCLPIEFTGYKKFILSFIWINHYENDIFGFFHMSMLYCITGIYIYNIIKLRNTF